tara:strand:+ start:218 stop:571 length:354 start_codon:yes stop_codon:yes gene_type:complete
MTMNNSNTTLMTEANIQAYSDSKHSVMQRANVGDTVQSYDFAGQSECVQGVVKNVVENVCGDRTYEIEVTIDFRPQNDKDQFAPAFPYTGIGSRAGQIIRRCVSEAHFRAGDFVIVD